MIKEEDEDNSDQENHAEVTTINNMNLLKKKTKRYRKIKITGTLFKKEIKAKYKHNCDILVSKKELKRYDKSTAVTENINQLESEEEELSDKEDIENKNEKILLTSEDFLKQVTEQEKQIKKIFFSSKLKYFKKKKIIEILKKDYEIYDIDNMELYILIFLLEQLRLFENEKKCLSPFISYLIDYIYLKKKAVIKQISGICLNYIPQTVKKISEESLIKIKRILAQDKIKFKKFYLNKEVLEIVKEIYSKTKCELKNSKSQKDRELKS
jgi:hypothetical protein